MTTLYDRIADLPLTIEGYTLERMETPPFGDFIRVTTLIHMRGDGAQGVGEDVTYEPEDHDRLQELGPVHDLTGVRTFGELSELVEGLDLFPVAPEWDAFVLYRRWAFESAALDLALRQAGTNLADVLGIVPRPVRFVASMRFPEPPEASRLLRMLRGYPGMQVKLDPTPDWDDAFVASLVDTGAVVTLDLKGAYEGSIVDRGADPALYARCARAFPDAFLEDPRLNDDTRAALGDAISRVTWDAPIHSLDDVTSLADRPAAINVKPSRVGSFKRLFELYEGLREAGIPAYGGGQTELGPGRGHIQYLASLFHADGPNDVAPREYNLLEPPEVLPRSPLQPKHTPTGFRWGI